jgi:membrane protein YdbS with pleckstrin-like domain
MAGSIATESLPPSVLTLWRVVTMIETVVLFVGAVVIGVVTGLPLLLAGLVLLAGVFGAVSWWAIDLRYLNWRWGLDERWIERRNGVVVRTTQIVPRSRVQTLTTRTGPLDRWLGLSAIVVHTAGTHTPNLTIPHLEKAAAEHIRAELGG